MSGTAAGSRRTAAIRLGVPLEEYRKRVEEGEKWCIGCKEWHDRSEFGTDRSRYDALTASCKVYRSQRSRQRSSSRPRPQKGRRYVAARNGDVRQARRRVNYLVSAGLIPAPNTLPCTDCGHVWRPGQLRHEHDHHLGYAPEHHEDVEAVCTTCHHDRETARKRAA